MTANVEMYGGISNESENPPGKLRLHSYPEIGTGLT